MPKPPLHDAALLDRIARVLHDMGLPCACQDEVERTVAVFAEFEARRSRRRLLERARERASRLRAYIEYLDDLDDDEIGTDEITAFADSFRVISAAAAEGAASLEMLEAVWTGPDADACRQGSADLAEPPARDVTDRGAVD